MSHCQLTPDYKSHLDLEYRRKVTFGAPCPVVRHGRPPVIQYLTEGDVEDAKFEASLGYGSALPVAEPMSCKPAAHFWLLLESTSRLHTVAHYSCISQ